MKEKINFNDGIPMQYWDEKKGGLPLDHVISAIPARFCEGKKLHFIKSCYHECHEAVWKRIFNFDGNEI